MERLKGVEASFIDGSPNHLHAHAIRSDNLTSEAGVETWIRFETIQPFVREFDFHVSNSSET
jgi:hypothetical protein